MPEGDSLYQISVKLQELVGQPVLASQIRRSNTPVTALTGHQVAQIWPYGKHLFMQFTGPSDTILHTHLKMEGVYELYPQGTRWRRPGFQASLVLDFPQVQLVGFQLGKVELFPTSSYEEKMGYLGPDVLYDDWETWGKFEAQRRIAASGGTIGEALLDQRLVAGIGNEFRAEICFLAGVHPAQPVQDTNLAQVLQLARKLLYANRLQPYRSCTGDLRPGKRTWVFGRAGQPCRRCHTVIAVGTLGAGVFGQLAGAPATAKLAPERIIWWCPNCQPAPAGVSRQGRQ